jgi:hypothetical protein
MATNDGIPNARAGLPSTNPLGISLSSAASMKMTSEGSVLHVTVLGLLTELALSLVREVATQAMNDGRTATCLIDLQNCIAEFDPALLGRGFLQSDGPRPDDRPCALVVASHRRMEFTVVAREAARLGVLMPVFSGVTGLAAAGRFLEDQAPLWWTDRRYPGLPRATAPFKGIGGAPQ